MLAMAGVISGTAPVIVPAEAVLAQSLGARQSLAIEGPTTVEFPENSTVAIATYRVANAASDSTISWSIDGTDARRLSIDDSGVLHFKAAKNFERPNDGNRDNEYEIELSAAVGSTQVSVEVIVRVTDVNEPPVFELESAAFSVEENASGNRRVGGALVVTDPDEGDSRTFSVEGEDAGLFHIDDEGQIRVRPGAVLDYETLGILSLTALVTDQGSLSDSLPVQIGLTDEDDPGVVTFLSAKPFIGVPFIATVSDQDGVTGRIRWRWHRAMNANDEFERIDGATRNSYTPLEDDEGYILRSTVSYEDNFEVGATASEISATVGRNAVPEFDSTSITLTVPEEAPAGTDVGDSVTATDSDGGDLSYTLSGEDASYFEINALTGQISVGAQALPDSETKDSYNVIVTATDEAGATGSVTVLISVAPPDVEPSIIGPATVSFTENGTGVVATYSVADLDNDNVTWSVAGTDAARFSISDSRELSFSSSPDYENPSDGNKDNVYEVTVVVSHGNRTAELDAGVTVTNVNEAASITGPATVSYSENGTENVTTYSATDSEGDEITWGVAGVDAALFGISESGELTFGSSPDHENPNDANTDNVYEVTVTASDGNLESTLDVEVTVTDVNEAAVIAGPTSVSYVENGTASVATYTATDPEGDEVTLDIAGADVAQFALNVGGELSFNSPPDYEETHDANNDNVYEVTVTASDGQLESTLDVKITVTDFAEAILITGPATLDYAENGTATVATYMAADPNKDGITWGIAGADAVRFAIGVTGGLSFNSPPDFEKPRDGNKDNVYEVTVVASDGNLTAELDVEVAVIDVNEAASITGPATGSYSENATKNVATYSATDPEGDGISWGIAGTDVSRFSIKETGELSFNSPPDYEKPRDGNKDNVYEVTVVASDGNLTAELDVEVTVTDVNEAVSITGPAAVSHIENTVENVATYSATDSEGDEITWGIAGADMSRFSIKETGELSFNSPPDYEKPRDGNKNNVFEVTVTASDGNLESTLDIEITVTNVNEAPIVTGLATASYAENGTASVATYTATDPEGDEFTLDIAGTDTTQFVINVAGVLSFSSPPDHEKPRDANKDNTYEVTVTASDGHLESSLDVEVTVTDVAEAILITGADTVGFAENSTVPVATYTATDPEGGGITWRVEGADVSRFSIKETGELSFNLPPDHEKPRDANNDNVYEVRVTASDGNLLSTLEVEVTVTNVNEPAVITGRTTISYSENEKDNVAIYSATDAEGDGITWGVEGADVSRFSIKETGELSFNSPPDYESPQDANIDNVYEVMVTASDGNLESMLDIEITVTNVNESPMVSGPATVTFAENGTAFVATYTATDPESDEVSWDISGADVSRFSIREMGKLSFNSPPDYEKPRDANNDNIYEVTAIASGDNLESTLDIKITVTNVNESPMVTGLAIVSLAENGTASVATYTATDPEGDEVTWAIAGTDISRFSIKGTGELSFNSPPDYERPRDANKDNVYEVTVTASGRDLSAVLDVEVTVTNVNESVTISGPTSVTFAENDITTVAVYSATDPEGSSITWEVVGTDVERISISGMGELSFNLSPDYENPKDANKDNVYRLTVAASDGDLTSTLDVEVTVTDVTEPATITGPDIVSYEENSKDLVATYKLADSEGGDDSPTDFRIAGIDAAHFVIDFQGTLAFITPPNFESPLDADVNNMYAIQIVANDDGNESSLNVVVEVTDANDAPRFPSRAIVAEIPENSCPGAYRLYRGIGGDLGIETDEDGDPLTYVLTGPDERTFVIHPPTGYVTLGPGTLLDFETSRKPFTVRVSVSDGRDDLGNTENEFNADDHLDLTVVVSDIDEPPVFSEAQLILDACGSPVGYGPGQLRREVTAGVRGGSPVGAALSVIDSEGESVRFRIVSQSDPGAFIVESSTGQIMVAPDFSPRDARRVYTLRVATTDGELESQIEVRIAVIKAPKPTPEPDVEDSSTPNPKSGNDAEASTPVQSDEILGDSSPLDGSDTNLAPTPDITEWLPDIEDSSTPNSESGNDTEVSTPVQSDEISGDSSPLDGNATNSAPSPNTLSRPPIDFKQVDPVFVPVPGAVQTLLFGRSEVQDQTGRARLTAPAATLAVPYQVRLTQDEAACVSPIATAPPQDCVCVSVEFFDVRGAPLEKESLNRPALLEIVLRTQDEAKNNEIEKVRAEIGRDSVEVMMRQDDEHEWAYVRGDLRRPADGSSILMVRVRAPGQYMALVTESGTERKAPVSAIPLNLVKTADTQQAQTTVTKSVAERSAAFFYEPVVVHTQPQPAPFVSAEPQPWQTMRLLIALLLDVTVALSAGILLQRFTFRRH